jgi:glutamyl-Q tRNA(Asp) synthetase
LAAYIGRFAPSPTGPLHLGSLYTALASYLDAKQHQGLWLLRLDDSDIPRNQAGAADAIIQCLLDFGLQWDGDVVYQHQHQAHYQQALTQLQHQLYHCHCSRKQLAEYGDHYPGFCREHPPADSKHCALRLRVPDSPWQFTDRLQGLQHGNLAHESGDFVLQRRDSIIAYQLAVVVDDYQQQISHVVRGNDLLDSTAKQRYLQQCLHYPSPHYLHLPVIVDGNGQKLSKQTAAEAVSTRQPAQSLLQLLTLLQQQPPASLRGASVASVLEWAIAHWQPQALKKIRAIAQPFV